jgi:hypothetical protein
MKDTLSLLNLISADQMDPKVVDDFRNMFLIGQTRKQLDKLIHTVEDNDRSIINTVNVT